MEAPVPPPRNVKKDASKNDAAGNGEKTELTSTTQRRTSSVIQVSAEIHNSKTEVNNSDQKNEEKPHEKKKRKLRKRGTFIMKDKDKVNLSSNNRQQNVLIKHKSDLALQSVSNRGSLTETISDSDSGKIKLVPLRPVSARRRAPAGSATETLSDESDDNNITNSARPTFPIPPIPARRKSLPSTKVLSSNNKNNDRPKSAVHRKLTPTPSPPPHLPPVPAPRNSIGKSAERIVSPYCTSSSVDYQDTDVLSNKTRKHKKKRKLKDSKEEDEMSKKSSIASSSESFGKHRSSKQSPRKEKMNEEMACITIHNCEPLSEKHFSSRPIVVVHVVDLPTSKCKRSSLGKIDIKEVTTSPFDYSENKLSMPTWEEDLLLLEPLSHIVTADTLIIFEIKNEQNNEILAWAFLKPVAANGALNTGKTLRLQLYKPGKPIKDNSLPKGFQWWIRAKYTNYKSTLFVTLNGVPSELIVTRTTTEQKESKEKMNDKEVDKNTSEEDRCSLGSDKVNSDFEEIIWNRLPALTCKLPNTFLITLDTGTSGCMAVAYSLTGLYLVAQVGDNIGLFSFKGKHILNMTGHQGLIYCLRWTKDDKYLLSSSADTTTCVWDIANRKSTPIQVLPHPSYVYSCCWIDESMLLILTACYDKYIRVWKLGTKCPIQLLLKHTSPINSVTAIDNNCFISGDSTGVMICWKLNTDNRLEFERELILREIKGKIINKLIVHPGKKRLLVHTRDSVLRMVDIATGSVVQWFRGGLNNRLRCDSCLCGCGSRVFASCEDGTTCCWDSHTGQMIAIYTRLQTTRGVASIDFHPRDHYFAISSHSLQGTSSLSIVKYDRDSIGKEVGMVYIDPLQPNLAVSSQSLCSSLSSSRSNPSLLNDNNSISSHSISTPLPTQNNGGRKNPQHRRKDFGIFSAILGRKKTKKGETNNGYQVTEDESNLGQMMKGIKKISAPIANLQQQNNDNRDHRLSDIIKRMDKILTNGHIIS